jgi:hypothetical protein
MYTSYVEYENIMCVGTTSISRPPSRVDEEAAMTCRCTTHERGTALSREGKFSPPLHAIVVVIVSVFIFYTGPLVFEKKKISHLSSCFTRQQWVCVLYYIMRIRTYIRTIILHARDRTHVTSSQTDACLRPSCIRNIDGTWTITVCKRCGARCSYILYTSCSIAAAAMATEPEGVIRT